MTTAKKTGSRKTKTPAASKTAASSTSVKAAGGRQADAEKPRHKTPASKKSAAKKTSAKKASSGVRSAADKYTDPALRDHIKDEVMAGDKGGRAGQWSARKAQMVAHEYEAEGGGYKGGKDETQKSLTSWGDEHWQTSDGQPAHQADGMHRYLPEAAWQKLSPEEKKATDHKKLQGDHQGKQFVANTAKASRARKSAQK